jgi:hypothetical protein
LDNQELDRDSAEFKRRLLAVTITVLGLGGIGGLWLGYKIQAAERADARIEASQSSTEGSGAHRSPDEPGTVAPPSKKDHPPRAGD